MGKVGSLLAIAPGYASPAFPAAGLALAVALHFGVRALPGVFIGSLLLNLSILQHNGTQGSTAILATLLIATGACLQAWSGKWLIERFLKTNARTLEQEHSAATFLSLGGLIACLISSSCGTSVLHFSGLLNGSDTVFAWWIWYLGDALGTLTITPLLLFLLDPDKQQIERGKRLAPPNLLLFLLIGLSFFGAGHWQEAEMEKQLETDGAAIAKLIDNRLLAHREVLASLRRFLEVTPDLSFSQFERFTASTLLDNSDIFALSFNSDVRQSQRMSFERAMSEQTRLPGYQITERNKDNKLVRASEREQYVAVSYIAPLQSNLSAVGFDLNSEPLRKKTLELPA